MAAEYRYDGLIVPDRKVARFERLLKCMRIPFATKTPPSGKTIEDAQAELTRRWEEETAPVRQLVAQFVQPQVNPVVESGIKAGIIRLVEDSYMRMWDPNPPCPTAEQITANVVVVRKALANKFIDDLPEGFPDYVRLLPTPRGDVLALSADVGRKRFAPREIAFLVRRYGLSTGLAESYSKIARDYGVSAVFAGQSTRESCGKVFYFLQSRRVELFQP